MTGGDALPAEPVSPLRQVIGVLQILLVLACVALLRVWHKRRQAAAAREEAEAREAARRSRQVGDISLQTLSMHDGMDPTKQILLAVEGTVYDVSRGRSTYGPGKELAVYAGREVARALALGSLQPHDCTSDLSGLSDAQLAALADKRISIAKAYEEVGRVVPLKRYTASDLAAHDGSSPDKPILLSIQGTIYDVTRGKMFYGPQGVYPFAGRECARALARMSTSLSDCTPDLTGLAACDVDTLRDWVLKFSAKYPIVGTLADADEEGDHAAGHESKQQQQPAPAAAAADDKKIK